MSEPALQTRLPLGAVPAPAGEVAEPAPRLRILPGRPEPGLDAPRALPKLTPRLEIRPYELSAALRLEHELGISHVLSQVLARRGLTDPREARAFLDPSDERHDPSAFAGIDVALEQIRAHVAAGARIVVHGDYDVDGVCATAIMVRALRALRANVGWFIPGRLEDGYGLTTATIERLHATGAELLITVDCGITSVEEVDHARALGLDVVITDHHAPRLDGALPDAPIIHPAVCGYPCEELCGTGVAHKLAEALGAPTASDDLDLVALATVADLVPLRGENRRLVQQGLRALAASGKPGIRALVAVSGTDPSDIDASALGFRLAPRLNAAGRVRRADAALELLLTEDGQRAAEVAGELDGLNAERRAVEQRITWEAEAQVRTLGDRSAYVLVGEDWHPGVIGIVASRIVERTHRPTIMISLEGELGTGSGRSVPGFDLLGALHSAAEHLERYGGHRAAAGLTIHGDRVEAFRSAVEAHADVALTADLREPVERIDAIVSGVELGLDVAEELARLEPCGMGNPGCRLLVPGARFGDVRTMGEDGRHARFLVTSGGVRARAVAFGCDGRIADDLSKPHDASFRLERNTWNGALEARLVLLGARPCAPAGIEVVGEPDDYLEQVFAELDAPISAGESPLTTGPAGLERVALDRRGESPLAVLADAVVSGGDVLAVCADVPRRIDGLRERVGAFTLISYAALERDPSVAESFRQLVALDPPTSEGTSGLLRGGCGFAHLAWGEPELRFAEQMHELEYALRTSLVAVYRGLRLHGTVAREELERLLRGDGPHGRSALLAARLIRVLAELELVSLNRDLPALAIANESHTALERSAAYRAYAARYEDGRRFLSSLTPRPSA
jgi:single-stranded-DNA-specific exonuclease